MSRLTVLQLVPNLESGGVERGTLEVAAELVDRSHRSLVISGGGRLVSDVTSAGSEHYTWPIGRKSLMTFAQVARLRSLIRKHRVDVVHARSRVPAWVAYLALKTIPRPIRPAFVTTIHGLNSVSRFSEVMTFGDRVIAVSKTARDYVTANYTRLDRSRIRVVHRGIDPEEFPYGFRPTDAWLDEFYSSFPQLRDRQIVTLPGRLTRLKGHFDLLDLITNLRTVNPNAIAFVVGGEDPRRRGYADKLYAKVESRGLSDSVVFAGHRSDMREIFSISDVVLSLSKKPESFGRTVVEALSLGTPVVGYSHGGVREVLTELWPLGLVPKDDPTVLLERVKHTLALSPSIPRVEKFRRSDMLDGVLSVYEELAAQHATASRPAA